MLIYIIVLCWIDMNLILWIWFEINASDNKYTDDISMIFHDSESGDHLTRPDWPGHPSYYLEEVIIRDFERCWGEIPTALEKIWERHQQSTVVIHVMLPLLSHQQEKTWGIQLKHKQKIHTPSAAVCWFALLTLARTCYFPILERTRGGGGCNSPHAISPLIKI